MDFEHCCSHRICKNIDHVNHACYLVYKGANVTEYSLYTEIHANCKKKMFPTAKSISHCYIKSTNKNGKDKQTKQNR